jgi:hypothetical protein
MEGSVSKSNFYGCFDPLASIMHLPVVEILMAEKSFVS